MEVDVSVIVPTHRRPASLKRAVESALQQEGVSVDVLVVDESPEGSAASIVQSCVAYLRRPIPGRGSFASSRNDAWPRVRGRFVHFLEDEDRVAPGAYRALVDALEASPERGVAFGCVEPYSDDADLLARERAYFERAARRMRLLRSSRWLVAQMLFQQTPLVGSACLIRRDCVPALGGYNPKCGDVDTVDFYLRAIRHFGCVFEDRVVVHHRAERAQRGNLDEAYAEMYRRYREAFGALELYGMKLLARTVLQLT
jgi:glycosyltransferase involved in cell wall biosynthesis